MTSLTPNTSSLRPRTIIDKISANRYIESINNITRGYNALFCHGRGSRERAQRGLSDCGRMAAFLFRLTRAKWLVLLG
jgi:hypothetical protein